MPYCWWTQRDSNPRPLGCEPNALPAELWARMGMRGERKAVARRVACDAMEMEAIHELIKKHVHVYFQTVPTRSSEEAKKYIKE